MSQFKTINIHLLVSLYQETVYSTWVLRTRDLSSHFQNDPVTKTVVTAWFHRGWGVGAHF